MKHIKQYSKILTCNSHLAIYLLLLLPLFVQSQACSDTEELSKIPGKFVDHNWTPAGGYVSDYSTAEKAMALKTLAAAEQIGKKNFFGNGFVGKGSFGFKQGEYFNTLFLGTYDYNIGFYQLSCMNGQIKTAHEYGTSLAITANPVIHPNLEVPLEEQGSKFNIKGSRKDRSSVIPLYRYIVFADKDEFEKINTGKGFTDGKREYHDAYDKNPDITRSWFITPPGKRLFSEVSRKEYLESLLEFYEIEKEVLVQRQERLLTIDRETLKQYEKDKEGKGKKDYQYFLSRIADYERDKAKAVASYTIKKNKVTALLKSKPDNWLQQAAALNPAVMNDNYRCDAVSEYVKTGAHTFNDFYDSEKGLVVYKWNPELFKQQPACTPVFFKVSLRYKEGIDISEAIKAYYTKNFDFAAIQKLLEKK